MYHTVEIKGLVWLKINQQPLVLSIQSAVKMFGGSKHSNSIMCKVLILTCDGLFKTRWGKKSKIEIAAHSIGQMQALQQMQQSYTARNTTCIFKWSVSNLTYIFSLIVTYCGIVEVTNQ